MLAQVYRGNGAGSFSSPIPLTGLYDGALAWIDANNDGYLDLIATGNAGSDTSRAPTTIFYKYGGGGLTASGSAGLPALRNASLAPGDYDNDGDLDLLLNGQAEATNITAIYRNTGGMFVLEEQLGLTGSGMPVAWGHLDADRDLDIAISGVGDAFSTSIYTNTAPAPNNAPEAPSLIAACYDDNLRRLHLDWTDVSSDATPADGLTYNLRLGTAPGSGSLYNPASPGGLYRKAGPGNVGTESNHNVNILPAGVTAFTWAVQAVDAAYTSGPFSAEGTIDLTRVVAAADSYEVVEDTPATLTVLSNDAAAVSVQRFGTFPGHGNVALADSGTSVRYSPYANYTGPDSFTYFSRDAAGNCTRARVTLNVVNGNDAPTSLTLSYNSVPEGQPAGSEVGTFSATDPDAGDTLTFSLAAGAGDTNNAQFAINGSTLVTAAPLAPGSYSIRAAVVDPRGARFEASFTIQARAFPTICLTAVEAPGPDCPDTVTVTMGEDGLDSLGGPLPFALSLSASDLDSGETLSWSISAPPAHGAAGLEQPTTTSGGANALEYTPAADYNDNQKSAETADSFIITVSDGTLSDSIQVYISILPVNDLPSMDPIPDRILPVGAGPQTVTLTNILAGPPDENGQPLTVSAEASDPALIQDLTVSAVAGGTASLTFMLQPPAPGAIAAGSIIITLSDGQSFQGTSQTTFQVQVEWPNKTWLPIIAKP